MQTRRIVGNAFLAAYLWITLCAFCVTVLNLPLYYPKTLVLYAYGMMAPYRSHDTMHVEVLAEGETESGGWEKIDLDPYYPVLFGEMSVRTYFAMWAEEGKHREPYARRLLALEAAKGRAYRSVRFTFKQWPNEPGGYHHNDLPYVTKTTPLGQFK